MADVEWRKKKIRIARRRSDPDLALNFRPDLIEPDRGPTGPINCVQLDVPCAGRRRRRRRDRSGGDEGRPVGLISCSLLLLALFYPGIRVLRAAEWRVFGALKERASRRTRSAEKTRRAAWMRHKVRLAHEDRLENRVG